MSRPSTSAALESVELAVSGMSLQLERLGPGDHVCLIFEHLEEQLEALGPFLRAGLARGERCLYVVDERSEARVMAALDLQGLDVERVRSRGALVFLRESHLPAEARAPEGWGAYLQRAEAEALAAGFTGLRVTGEMAWALAPERGCEHLVRREASLDHLSPRSRTLCLCQYDRYRFPPHVIRDVMRAHPLLIIGKELHENLFYEAPERFLGEEPAMVQVEGMVMQLQRVRAAERKLLAMSKLLAEQALENARLCEEAQEAVRLRDEFLSVASHELKTPLTPLHLRLQGLRREAEANPGGQLPCERVLRLLDGAEQQLRKLAGLVDELLDVSCLSQEPLRLAREDVDLAALVRQVVDRSARQSAWVGCPVEVAAEEPVVGQWDRGRLEQVVTSLLSNALKYGAGQPVRLRVQAGPERAVLLVEDQGIGIAPEHLRRIFGKFERAVSGRHYGGLGLGLYLADQLVRAMGGRIQVLSQPGRGSTFRVELPRTPGHAAS